MHDERRQQLMEQYEEAAISLLMDKLAEAEGAGLLREFEEASQNGTAMEIPAELDAKCRKLIEETFAKQKRGLRLKRIVAPIAKAAVIVLLLLGLSTATVLSVDALRIPVLNFLADQSGRYSSVIFNNHSDAHDPASDNVAARLENNLPEGYSVVQNSIVGSSGTIVCSNAENHLIYLEVTQTECGLNVDTEDNEYTNAEFGDYQAVFQDKGGYHLRWLNENGQTVYTLVAKGISISEFWELAYAIAE